MSPVAEGFLVFCQAFPAFLFAARVQQVLLVGGEAHLFEQVFCGGEVSCSPLDVFNKLSQLETNGRYRANLLVCVCECANCRVEEAVQR